MRPFGDLISKEDALARLLAAAWPVTRVETLPLGRAAGRVSAEEVRAAFPVPPYARATMDGYAVRAADTREPGARLSVIGDVFAGASRQASIAHGEALRIATGAPVPQGADAVVRVEDTSEADGIVTIRVAVPTGRAIDPAGVDLEARALVVAEGAILTPARLGLIASIGRADARVLAKPRVAIFASGDELLRPGAARDPARIYDSNSTTIAALVEAAGCEARAMPHLPDDRAAIERAIRDAADTHDAIVVTGGASAGAKDLLIDAARALGSVLFHGVRVKPGKPLLAATIGDALLVGLPGNPTSALSNGVLFLAPALRRMAGLPPGEPAAREATLAAEVAGEKERFLFLPVKLDDGQATPTFKGSGALTSIAASDGWIGVPEGAVLARGSRVIVHAWW